MLTSMDFLIAGIPAHPLFVHLAVVAVPVGALLTLALIFKPKNEPLRWVNLGVVAVAVVALILSRWTGEGLLVAQGLSEANPGKLGPHMFYANLMTGAVLAQAAVIAVEKFLRLKEHTLAKPALWVAGLVAIAVIVTTVLTGHAGAAAVWSN